MADVVSCPRRNRFEQRSARSDDTTVLKLTGELDLVTMAEFEVALETALAEHAGQIVIDTIGTSFISARGYAAMGRCGLVAEQVTICSRDGFAREVLQLLGYEDTLCITTAPVQVAANTERRID